jgi:YidC/Oxa1 family membrane protein insertase
MNQTRQLIGYFLIFFAVSMLWQSWSKYQDDLAAKAASKTLPETAGKHVDTIEAATNIEVAPKDRLITVETGTTTVKIDQLGGRIVEVDLNDYKKVKGGSAPVSFLGQDKNSFLTSQFGMTGDSAVLFSSSENHYKIPKDKNDLTVTIEGVGKNGILYTKKYTFYRDKYQFLVDTKVKNNTSNSYNGHPYSQFRQFIHDEPPKSNNFLARLSSMTRFNTFTGVSYYSTKDNYVKIQYKELDEKQIDKNIVGGWVSIQKPYFLSAWVPQNNQVHHLYTNQKPYSDGKVYTAGMLGKQVVVTPGEEFKTSSVFYSGPEITSILSGIAKGLDLTIDYGWLWMLSNTLFWLLENINRFVNNWGVSIIAVTVMIKALFYKMSESSYVSISKMKKIQPRLEALKKIHGDDREKLGAATRDLFLKEKVNPLGGCLPVLIQIPFFIALYYVLIESIQLRHAPFALWIQDLSAPDPFFVLPVLMGISMLYQQSLNPKPEDPVQANMMYFFPVFLTLVFSSFPSGLVLYWVTNNVLSIVQQSYVTKRLSQKNN